VKEDHVSHSARSLWLNWPGLGEAILGLLLIVLPLQTYSVYVNSIPAFSNSSLSLLEPLAYLVLTSTLSGILVVVLGIRRFLNELRLGSVSGRSLERPAHRNSAWRCLPRLMYQFTYAQFADYLFNPLSSLPASLGNPPGIPPIPIDLILIIDVAVLFTAVRARSSK